jgi:hypothetical protein
MTMMHVVVYEHVNVEVLRRAVHKYELVQFFEIYNSVNSTLALYVKDSCYEH